MTGSNTTWHDIEPYLKWAAVAYGFGFLTVMLHTARLGIPVLELIEPINIWIGMPLAVVLFFVGKLRAWLRRARMELVQRLADSKKVSAEISVKSPVEVAEVLFSVTSIMLSSSPALTLLLPLLKKRVTATLNDITMNVPVTDVLAAPLKIYVERVTWWVQALVRAQIVLVSVTKFVAVVVNIIAIPVACALYVWAAYPRIPQTIGGGEPMRVHLIVSEANLGMLGVLGWSPQNQVENVGAHLIPATLRYRTDAGYYVDLSSVDGTVFVSGGAIDGITFETRSQTIQPPRRP